MGLAEKINDIIAKVNEHTELTTETVARVGELEILSSMEFNNIVWNDNLRMLHPLFENYYRNNFTNNLPKFITTSVYKMIGHMWLSAEATAYGRINNSSLSSLIGGAIALNEFNLDLSMIKPEHTHLLIRWAGIPSSSIFYRNIELNIYNHIFNIQNSNDTGEYWVIPSTYYNLIIQTNVNHSLDDSMFFSAIPITTEVKDAIVVDNSIAIKIINKARRKTALENRTQADKLLWRMPYTYGGTYDSLDGVTAPTSAYPIATITEGALDSNLASIGVAFFEFGNTLSNVPTIERSNNTTIYGSLVTQVNPFTTYNTTQSTSDYPLSVSSISKNNFTWKTSGSYVTAGTLHHKATSNNAKIIANAYGVSF